MIKVKQHTEGDSRVSKTIPSFRDFHTANVDHIDDVKNLSVFFAEELKRRMLSHDWTKITEPYESMFYRDLCAVLEGRMDFFDGEWSNLHYNELERHHLKRHCPEDVDMFDVIEMLCDCVAAGVARTGDIYDVDIPAEVLTKAVGNTVKVLKSQIEVVEK